jgi:hypothetical protein|tara:strand:+ start:362 stop:772 length:411 start_codon:yes stop_codon:yes gene_type:complete
MKHKYGKIDFSEWNLPSIDNLTRVLDIGLRNAVEEVFQSAIDEDLTYVSFPIIWSDSDGHFGPPVTDPLTMYITFYEDGPVFETTLYECLEGDIDSCIEDGSFSDGLKLLSMELRKLADKIDTAVQTERSSHEPAR